MLLSHPPLEQMGIVEIDEANVVNEMMKLDAEYITFDEFKTWSSFASKDQQDTQVFVDPFGNSNVLPERFRDARHVATTLSSISLSLTLIFVMQCIRTQGKVTGLKSTRAMIFLTIVSAPMLYNNVT